MANEQAVQGNASTEATGTAAKAAEGKAAERANIVRGTIPHPLVYLIRFAEKGGKEGDIAKKYGTTGGKVADIVKGRNFAYIDEDYVPTQEAKDAAIRWLKQVPGYDEVGTDQAVSAVEKMGVATEADLAKLATKRAAARATNSAKSGDGEGKAAGSGETLKAGETPKPVGATKGEGKSGGATGSQSREHSKADVDALMK